MCCLLTKVREHWFPESRRHILTIVLVKTIFTMWRSNLELDLQCFSYLSLEPAFIDLQCFHIFPVESRITYLRVARNTSQVPLFITDCLFVLFHSSGNFQRFILVTIQKYLRVFSPVFFTEHTPSANQPNVKKK